MKVGKMAGLPLFLHSKKDKFFKENCIYEQVEAQVLMKEETENVRQYVLKVQQLVESGWCKESAATINFKFNAIFTRGLPKTLEDFIHKPQVKHEPTVLELFVPFDLLVKFVVAEDITNEKIRTFGLPLEINDATSETEPQNLSSEKCDPNHEIIFTQPTDLNNKSRPQFWKHCNFCHETSHSISNCFSKQRDDEERKRSSYSRSNSPVKSFNQYFKLYQNQIHPTEQHSNYPRNYYSRNSYDSRNCSNSRNRHSPNRFSPSSSRDRCDNFRSPNRYRNEKSNSN